MDDIPCLGTLRIYGFCEKQLGIGVDLGFIVF